MQCQKILEHSLPQKSYHSMITLPDESLLCLFGSMEDSSESPVYILEKGSRNWKPLRILPSTEDGIPVMRYSQSSILRSKKKERPHSFKENDYELTDKHNNSNIDFDSILENGNQKQNQDASNFNLIHEQEYEYEIVVFGGISHGKVLNDIWRISWDMSGIENSAQWICEKPIDPFLYLSGHGAIYDEEKDAMLVFGGKNQNKTVTNYIYEYSFKYKTWKQIVETNIASPLSRQDHGMVKWNNNFLVFGGNNITLGKVFKDLWCFDLKKREWKQWIARNNHCIQPPEASSPAIEILNDRIYIYPGGSHRFLKNEYKIDYFFVYDIVDNCWLTQEIRGSLPPPRVGHTLTKVFDTRHYDSNLKNNQILYPSFLLCGGSNDSGEVVDIFEFFDAEVILYKQDELLRSFKSNEIKYTDEIKKLQSLNEKQNTELDILQSEKTSLINRDVVYKAHFTELDILTNQQKETIKDLEQKVQFLESECNNKTTYINELESSVTNLTNENNGLKEQLMTANISIESLKRIREENIVFMESQEKQFLVQQLKAEKEITNLKQQIDSLTSNQSELLSQIEQKNQDIDDMNRSMNSLVLGHKEAIDCIRQEFITEKAKILSIIATYKEDAKLKDEELKNLKNQLNLRIEMDDFIFSEKWRLPEEDLQILSSTTGNLKGNIVEIISVDLGNNPFQIEKEIASQLFTETRVKSKFLQTTYGAVISHKNSKAIVVRERMTIPLKDYLNEKKPSIEEKIAIIHQVAFSMKTLHKKQVTLRSFHPGVIQFFIESGKAIPKICLYLCNGDIISEKYIAPELQSTEMVADSYKVDIFSLGMVMYYILAETDPLWSVVKGEFGILSHSLPSFNLPHFQIEEGKKIQQIIQKCHELNPNNRPHIDEILNEIRNI